MDFQLHLFVYMFMSVFAKRKQMIYYNSYVHYVSTPSTTLVSARYFVK